MLMLKRKDTCPVDYRMCNQTVTVYHNDGGKITQTEYTKAFLDFRKNQTVDKTGSREVNSFLLVIPCATQAVFVEDKVLLGSGPEITHEEWAAFIPAKVPNLVVVKYVDAKYWGDQMIHVEAGG
jgi:hypothetical protein